MARKGRMESRYRIIGLFTHNNKLITTVLLLLQFLCTNSEFRFCAEGTWHQVTGTECKYGVYFPEPMTTPCYHTSGNESNLVPRIWPTPCDHPFVESPNIARQFAIETDQYTLAQKYGEFQFILYGSEGNLSNHPDMDDLTTLQECSTTCHIKQVGKRDDHDSSDSVEDLGRIRPKLNATIVKQLTDQTLRLGDYLYDQLMEQDPNPGPDLRIVRLFKKTMEVMGRTCQHPFIAKDFLTRVLYGFLFLVTDNGVGDIDDVTVEEYEDIMEALKICSQTPPNFRLEGKACSMVSTVERVITIGDDGMELSSLFKPSKLNRGERKFPYETYDIVIESAWQAVQVVHGSCFATFRPNANMHHRYTAAMEQLFGKKIMQRWMYPTQLIDSKLWGTWFLSDVDSTYFNTIACVRASYEGAPFAMKLDRPIDSNRNSEKLSRKKRSSEFSSIDEYWVNYYSTGGIIKHLEDKIVCFQTLEDRERVFQEYRERVCPELDFLRDVSDFGDYIHSNISTKHKGGGDESTKLPGTTDPNGATNPNAGNDNKIPIPTEIDLDNPPGKPTGTGSPPPSSTGDKIPIPTEIDLDNPPGKPTGTGSPPPSSTGDKIPIPTEIDLDVPPGKPTGTGSPPPSSTGDKIPIPTEIDLDVPPGKPVDTGSPSPTPTDTGSPTGDELTNLEVSTAAPVDSRIKTTHPTDSLPTPTYIDLDVPPGKPVDTGSSKPTTTDTGSPTGDELPEPTYIDLDVQPGKPVDTGSPSPTPTDTGSRPPTTTDTGSRPPTPTDTGSRPPTTTDTGSRPPAPDTGSRPPTTTDTGRPTGDKLPEPTYIDLDVQPGKPVDTGSPSPTPTDTGSRPPTTTNTGSRPPTTTDTGSRPPTTTDTGRPTGDKLPEPTYIDLDVQPGKPVDTGSPSPTSTDTESRPPTTTNTGRPTREKLPEPTYIDFDVQPGTPVNTGSPPPTTTNTGSRPPTTTDTGSRPPTTTDTGSRPPTTTDTGSRPPTTTDTGSRPPTPTDTGSRPPTTTDTGRPTGDKLPKPTYIDVDVQPGKPVDTGSRPPTTTDTGSRPPTTTDTGSRPPTTTDTGSRPPTTTDTGSRPPTTSNTGSRPPTTTDTGSSSPPPSNTGSPTGNKLPEPTYIDFDVPRGKRGVDTGTYDTWNPEVIDDDEALLDM